MSKKEMRYPEPSEKRKRQVRWDGRKIKALREHLGMTQSQMAEELQVRQQTISEWEIGMHTPHRSTQKVLSMVAEQAGFLYQTETEQKEKRDSQEQSDNSQKQSDK
jgi:DNA-binding transcriptional regulator YiaG